MYNGKKGFDLVSFVCKLFKSVGFNNPKFFLNNLITTIIMSEFYSTIN